MSTLTVGSAGTDLLDSLLQNPLKRAGLAAQPGGAATGSASAPDVANASDTADTADAPGLEGLADSALDAVSQFAAAFQQAWQGASSVDPASGHRELSSAADARLAGAFQSLLVQSGFSQQQAATAGAALSRQLAAGGKIDLSADYDAVEASGTAMSASYGAQSVSTSAVAVNERAGSVSLELDLDTGTLDVSVREVQVSSYTATVVEQSRPGGTATSPLIKLLPGEDGAQAAGSGDGASGDGPGDLLSAERAEVEALLKQAGLPVQAAESGAAGNDAATSGPPQPAGAGAGNGTAEASAATNTAGKAAASNTPAATAQTAPPDALLKQLAGTSLHVSQAMLTRLQTLAAAASPPDAGAASTGTPAAGGTGALAVTFGFVQTVSLQQLDTRGYGATLYQRTDGSAGAILMQPLHLAA